jgi:SAM-dependent methyltransferase
MSPSTSYDSGTLAFYEKHAKEYCDSTAKLDLHELYDPFLKDLSPGAHILDAGCGSGRDTKAFLERGFRVTAIDVSSELAKLATALTGQRCETLSFQQMQFCNEFDGIWACASILHIPKCEISGVMDRFIRALKVGGKFYISLKENEGERIAEDGRFFNYYTANSFRELLQNFPALHEVAFWKTEETRSRHHTESWLNFLLVKVLGAS